MKKIQIFIEHDIVIRHFLHSNTFFKLEKYYEVQYVFPLNDGRVRSDVDSLGLRSVVKIPVDRKRLARLRHLSKIQTIRIARRNRSYKYVQTHWRSNFGLAEYAKMWLKSLPIVFPLYKKRVISEVGTYPEMKEVMEGFKPDLIIHPSVLEGLFVSDLAFLSERNKIPLVALMNSWDNPSSKAMIIRPPDWLVVWGEQTKKHAVEFMGMKPGQIKVFGAAQFEVYRQKPDKPREELCLEMGIDSGNKLILYAGSSKSVNELKHLVTLEEAVESGELKNCHVIFRPHPWRAPAEDESDFYDINWKHVSMEISMKNFYNSPKQRKTSNVNLTNYMDTHNILSAVDLVVSNASTIMLEAAIHGKPILCMVSNEDAVKSNHLKVILGSIFFQELLDKMNIPRCQDFANLPKLCSNLLNQASKSSFTESQRQNAHYFVDLDSDPYSTQLLRFINKIEPW